MFFGICNPCVVCGHHRDARGSRQPESEGPIRRPALPDLFLFLLEAGLPVGKGVALFRAGFHQLVRPRSKTGFLEGHRDVMAAVVLVIPGNADVLAAGADGVVGMIVLLLVLDADDLDVCLDGEGIEFARVAGLRGLERSDDEC